MKKFGLLNVSVGLSMWVLALPAMSAQHSYTATAQSTVAPFAQYGSAAEIRTSSLYFDNVDRDHDGFLSRSEVPKALHDLQLHFNQFDVDGNHRLDSGEYASYIQGIAEGSCRFGIAPCDLRNPYALEKGP